MSDQFNGFVQEQEVCAKWGANRPKDDTPLPTYPGYRPAFVAYDDLPGLEMIICDGCGYVVSQDEFLECLDCERRMCLYCYESGNCKEHTRRLSARRDKYGRIINE